MGSREVIITQTAAEQVAAISWFIESKGLTDTANNFLDEAYDFFVKLANPKRSYTLCREPNRAALGYKCVPYKKKYTVVLIETDVEIIISEFILSKLIYW